MPKYRVAVIGHTGRGNYGHGLDVVWNRIPNVQIVAVADADANGRAAAQKRIRPKNAYADYRQMLKKERPQIVSVATRWPDQHRNMVTACAEAGANIFVEKPLAPTLADADAMIASCEKHHVKCAIAHQTRYSPRVAHVKNMIEKGVLGDILEMRGRGKEDGRVGGQDLMVLGTHIMDLMRHFAGNVRSCSAKVGVREKNGVRSITKKDIRPGSEQIGLIAGNHISAMYEFESGAVGYFSSQYSPRRAGEPNRFGLQIFGSRGIVQLTTGSLAPTYLLADPGWFPARTKARWQLITSNGIGKPETIKDNSLVQGNVWVVQDLIQAIEKDRQPRGSIYDGRAALEMILAVYQSQRDGRPVAFPLKNRRHPLAGW